ncbi:hypothetical protein [Glutamicibacter nicotianae]|uniref:hypothetical protein n=1 Tax=Glutamicibacter nicotianae TaxID=37929 RepID=UPI00167F7D84|nr:hypothetical protein [Glutamicibacter nicotianae]
MEQRYTRAEAIRLATSILDAGKHLKANKQSMSELDGQRASSVESQFGFGAVTEAFVNMAGAVSPQASSRNTTCHRLNRSGDRLPD